MPESYYPNGFYPIGYYPAGYYPAGGDSGGGSGSSNLRLIFEDIVARLEATRAFAVVAWGGPTEELIPAADDYPCVAVEEVDWKEQDRYDSSTFLARSSFTVTIACKDSDPTQAHTECRRLAAIASNAVTRKSLARQTWASRTYLDEGRFARQSYPESRIILRGSFEYEIRTASARSER